LIGWGTAESRSKTDGLDFRLAHEALNFEGLDCGPEVHEAARAGVRHGGGDAGGEICRLGQFLGQILDFDCRLTIFATPTPPKSSATPPQIAAAYTSHRLRRCGKCCV